MNEQDSDQQGPCGLGGAWGFLGEIFHVILEGSGLSSVLAVCAPGPACFMFEFPFPPWGREGKSCTPAIGPPACGWEHHGQGERGTFRWGLGRLSRVSRISRRVLEEVASVGWQVGG